MTQNQNKRKIVLSHLTQPLQANGAGNVHGGEIMKMMDNAAGTVAMKYSKGDVVTARVDELMFHKPVMIDAFVSCTAEIVFVGNTSLEVLVTVEAEDLTSDSGPEIALTAFFTMVAMDENRHPKKIPPFTPETEEEWNRYRQAEKRRETYRRRLQTI